MNPYCSKALYLLAPHYFGQIYAPAEQAAIASLVEIDGKPVSAADYQASDQAWPEVELIFSGWGLVPMDEEFLRRFPSLKAVFYGAGSVKGLVTDAFWERDILLTSAYAANAVPVAEFALAQILLALKRGWQHVFSIRELKAYPHYLGSSLEVPGAFRTTVGLLSLGMTGTLVAEHLRRFDVDVIAYDPVVSSEKAERLGVRLLPLDKVCAQSDVVSCHTPLLKETEGMLRGRHFEMMKPGATFLNTARGQIVDEPEMIACLARRPDLLAILDVTWPEPPVAGSPLYTLPNVVLTPHIAGSQGPECRRMGRYMVEELERFLAGEPLRYGISRKVAAILA